MAAIMRVVSGVGGSTILDLNASPGGGIMNDRGEKALAQTVLSQDQISDPQPGWWSPLNSTSEVAERRISIPLTVFGPTSDQVASRISALQQAVDSPWVLEVRRHGASASGWLRCQPAQVTLSAGVNAVDGADRRGADVLLTAVTEPYALGALVDVGSLTFTQDPSVSTAFYQDINGVAGDAPAPTVIRWDLSGPLGLSPSVTTHSSVWAVRRHGTPSNLTSMTVQGESSTATALSGANVTTSVVTGDTALSGSSARRFTFGAGATVSDWGSATYTLGPSGLDAVGRYRLVGRFRRGGSGAGVQHVVRPSIGAYQAQDYTWPASSVDTRVLDLGLVQLPAGQAQALSAPIGQRPVSAPSIVVQVFKNGAAGSGTFDIDWLALLPADEDLGYWRVQQSSSLWAYLDGYALDPGFSTTDPVAGVSPVLRGMDAGMGAWFTGGAPRLGPGSNRLYCVQGFTGAAVWPKTGSVTASVAYWPRYRWLP